jgi:hypothetical protein
MQRKLFHQRFAQFGVIVDNKDPTHIRHRIPIRIVIGATCPRAGSATFAKDATTPSSFAPSRKRLSEPAGTRSSNVNCQGQKPNKPGNVPGNILQISLLNLRLRPAPILKLDLARRSSGLRQPHAGER